MPAGPLDVIDNFSKDFLFLGRCNFLEFERVDFDRTNLSLLLPFVVCFIFLLRRGTCRASRRCAVSEGILSICTIIALVHPSRCLREKHEKKGVRTEEIAMSRCDFYRSHILQFFLPRF